MWSFVIRKNGYAQYGMNDTGKDKAPTYKNFHTLFKKKRIATMIVGRVK
jgi:hypothetical protein